MFQYSDLETRPETPCREEGFGQGGRREQSEGPNLPEPRGPGIGGGVDDTGNQGAADPGGRQSRSARRYRRRFQVGSALRAGTIRSAFDFVPARLGQILTTLALLTSASLPKLISLNKAFRPDF